MTKCWAAPLEGCSEKLSREHLVPKGLFVSSAVDVHGFAWCKEAPARIGLESITRKMLCSKHNNDLSTLDQAAIDAFDAFRDQIKAMRETRPGTVPTTFRTQRIDAIRLERWLLKTLINFSFESEFVIGEAQETGPGVPSRELVEIVFGHRSFEGRSGMYVAGAVGQVSSSNDTIQFTPLIKEKRQISAGLFTFRGLNLALILRAQGPGAGGFAFSRGVDPLWRSLSLKRPFDRIDYAPIPNFVAHEIVFDWGSQRPPEVAIPFGHEDVVNAVRRSQNES